MSPFLQIIFCIAVLSFSKGIYAQKSNSIKLSDKLNEIEQKFDVSFSYNHTFFENIYLDKNIDCLTIDECISLIENLIPIAFKSDKNGNYMVLPKRKSFELQILDKETNENISYLEYHINNQKTQATSLKNNIFTLKDVFPLDSIHIKSNNYNYIHLTINDLINLKSLKLERKTIHLNKIVLSGYITKGIDAKISDHSFGIKTDKLGLLAGETDGDLFNVLKNIPGVQTPSGKPGNLNLRGNPFDQNLFQIDDIPIYHSGHFLGAISPYNSSVISDIKIHRNTLPAKWGGRVGGMINMTTYDKIPDSTNYKVSINSLFAGITAKTKLIDKKLSLTLAIRSSYPDFKTPKLEAISELIFQGSRLEPVADQVNSSSDFNIGFSDMNAKLNYKINNKHTTTLSFINIQNKLSANVKSNDDQDLDTRELELDNWGVTAKWQAKFTNKLQTEVRISKSNMKLFSESEGFAVNQPNEIEKYDNNIADTRFITELNYYYTPNLLFSTGYTLTEHKLTSEEPDRDTERHESALVHSCFVSMEKNWKEKLILNFGFHNHYYTPLKKTYINPRLSATYNLNNIFYLKSSLGTSNQFIQKKLTNDFDDFNITNQLWYLPDNQITPLKGTQAMIGAVLNKSKWLVDLEIYNKTTDNITNKSNDELGSLFSLGANIFIKRKWQKIETWMSYSVSKTQTKFKETVNVFYDQTHILNLTGLLNLNQWKFAASWGYLSGMPVIYSDENTNNINQDFGNRFNNQHQLDFSTTYTLHNKSKSLKSVIGLSLLNVYNQKNIVNIFQNADDNSLRNATGFAPNLQISFFF